MSLSCRYINFYYLLIIMYNSICIGIDFNSLEPNNSAKSPKLGFPKLSAVKDRVNKSRFILRLILRYNEFVFPSKSFLILLLSRIRMDS